MKGYDKRKLTPFLAHEMLFDYVTGQLDSERQKAIEEFIKEDRESQNLLEAIRRGIAYAESLKRIEISADAVDELDHSENLVSLSRRLARWSQWPDSLRWSLVALMISVCTAGAVMIIPWKTVPLFRATPGAESGSFEIARVQGRKAGGDDGQLVADLQDDNLDAQSGPLEGSGDEEFAEESSGVRPTIQAAGPAVAAPPVAASSVAVSPVTAPSVASSSVTRVSTPVPAPVPTQQAPAPATPAVVSSAQESTPASSTQKASRGYVYRAFMTLSDLENVAPKITQQLKELGAEKAGEVELGWRRGSGRYYHFSLPEVSEQKLMETLRGYGPVRISKDPHPRVMPQGQLRFILWVESGV